MHGGNIPSSTHGVILMNVFFSYSLWFVESSTRRYHLASGDPNGSSLATLGMVCGPFVLVGGQILNSPTSPPLPYVRNFLVDPHVIKLNLASYLISCMPGSILYRACCERSRHTSSDPQAVYTRGNGQAFAIGVLGEVSPSMATFQQTADFLYL